MAPFLNEVRTYIYQRSMNILIIGNNGAIGSALVELLKPKHHVSCLSLNNSNDVESLLIEKSGYFSSKHFELIICCIGVLHSELVSPEKN